MRTGEIKIKVTVDDSQFRSAMDAAAEALRSLTPERVFAKPPRWRSMVEIPLWLYVAVVTVLIFNSMLALAR